MIVIAFAVLLGIIGCVYIWTRDSGFFRDGESKFFGSGIYLGLVAGIAAFGVNASSGLMPEYSDGVREGYITKLSKKGIIWKTWEGQIQIGAGEQAALQAPWEFSTNDDKLAAEIQKNLGKRVVTHYNEWLVMPWPVGSSGHQIQKIEVLK